MFGFVENVTVFEDMTDPPKTHLLLQRHTVTYQFKLHVSDEVL